MDDNPFLALAAGAVVLLVGPVRRRAMSVAAATGRAGAGLATVAVSGVADVASAAIRPGGRRDPGAERAAGGR